MKWAKEKYLPFAHKFLSFPVVVVAADDDEKKENSGCCKYCTL